MKNQNNYFSAIIFRIIRVNFSQRQYLITSKIVLSFVQYQVIRSFYPELNTKIHFADASKKTAKPAPMKQFSRAFNGKYSLIPAPMKQLSCAFIQKYPLIPAPEKQFIFLAATAFAFQYPNKYSFISQKSKIFYVSIELLLTFHSIYDILNISIKKFLGRRIYLPPQLLSNVTDAFALQGLMRLFLF